MTDDHGPTVFLSHATEDKQRFALPFAERLVEKGLDVWVDQWEILAGDSLVKKIFAEGLDNASAVIVVISEHSLHKRWVEEELDAAVVKRIEEGAKLIPIVLDGVQASDVPASIRHLFHERVSDTSDLDGVVHRVIRAVHGEPEKPPLGASPQYVGTAAVRIGKLDKIDSLVLRTMGIEAVRDCGTIFRSAEFLTSVTSDLDITEQAAIESLEVLDNLRFIKIQRTLGSGVAAMAKFALTSYGLERYLRAYEPRYPTIESTTMARLADWPGDQGSEHELSERVGAPHLIVQHVLARCASRRLLKLSKTRGSGGQRFFGISPQLRRLASS